MTDIAPLLTLWRPVADSIRAWLAVRGHALVPELFLTSSRIYRVIGRDSQTLRG